MCRKFRKGELQLDVISRNEGSSTATGFAKQHQAQQQHIIAKAFDVPDSKPAKKVTEKVAAEN
jgi:2-oxoglutarate dehydrogenase E1 component